MYHNFHAYLHVRTYVLYIHAFLLEMQIPVKILAIAIEMISSKLSAKSNYNMPFQNKCISIGV